MRSCILRFIFVIGLFILTAATASAQNENAVHTNCLEKAAAKLDSGDWVSVVTRTSEVTTAHLVFLQPERFTISVSVLQDGASSTREFALEEIATIQYRRTGKLRPSYMVLGTLIGGVVGSIIGRATDPDCDGEGLCFEFGGSAGFVIGAVGGLVGGSVLSLALPATEKITCDSP